MMPAHNFIDETGKHYGRLMVLGFSHRNEERKAVWACRCECGTDVLVTGKHLRSGDVVSCGCFMRTHGATTLRTHGGASGGSREPEYKVWSGMIKRCENPATARYPLYGGRGIKVCARWRNDYAAFRDDMGPRPSAAHSIERINNDGDYEPENCRWALAAEQAGNKSNTRHVTINGQRMSLAEASRLSQHSYLMILKRLNRGMSDHEAVFGPRMRPGPKPRASAPGP